VPPLVAAVDRADGYPVWVRILAQKLMCSTVETKRGLTQHLLARHSANMLERDSGKGRLVSLASDSRMYIVDYVLETDTEAPERRYSLEIDEPEIPDGGYTLKTSDAVLRVRKTGRKWQVIN
jgi:hypothetical protein